MGAGPQKKTIVMNDEKPLQSAAPQGLLWYYFAKQDLARSADRST